MDENTAKMQEKHAELLQQQTEDVVATWKHPERLNNKYFDISIGIAYERYRTYVSNGFHWLAKQYAKKVGIK